MAMLLLLLPLLLQLAARGAATACPPPGSVKIQSFSYAGSGCPPGTAVGDISADGKALTVMFSKYYATTDKSLAERKRSCVVTVQLKYPRGFTVSVGTVTMRGYVKLDAGAVGTIQTWYYFSGLPGTARLVRKFTGVVEKNFEVTDKFLTLVYSRCNVVRNLNLASEAKVAPGPGYPSTGNGLVQIDSKDFSISQVWQLVWKKC